MQSVSAFCGVTSVKVDLTLAASHKSMDFPDAPGHFSNVGSRARVDFTKAVQCFRCDYP